MRVRSALRFSSWVVAAALVAAVPVLAQEDVGEDPDGPAIGMRLSGVAEARMILRRAQVLGLSPDTVAAVKEVSEKAQAAGNEGRSEIQSAAVRIGELLAQESLDEKAALAAADELGHLWAQGLKRRIRTSAELRGLLPTPKRRSRRPRSRPRSERRGRDR
jgi:hypothetical protein